MHQKKLALVNDVTGYGRCSIAVALPIVSALKVQGCILPTAILSVHTGFHDYYLDDYTDHMTPYIESWKKNGLTFDGISTGFLGSARQIDIVLDFLRDYGKLFSVNIMLSKEVVASRLEAGISFTEFSYQILQSIDFEHLFSHNDVQLQIGGADQWGNITSGIDLTRRLHQNQVFGLTVPLITKADGTKFGKTEGGAVWLDPKKTSPYKFYQFWINTADADVYRFLKFFTFMSIEEINALEEEDKNSGKAPRAQYVLAEQVTRLVHGEEGLQAAKRITECLFSGSLSALSEADFEQLAQDGVPMVEMEKGADLMQALVDSELQPSRGQARKTIASNAITINGEKQSDPEYFFKEEDRLFGRFTLLRRGKKNYCLICWK